MKENVPEDGASVNGINGGMERNAGQEPKLIVVKWVSFLVYLKFN